MANSMQAYLAAKYMSGPKADAILARTTSTATKKKKRKVGSVAKSSSSMIKDEDLAGWEAVAREAEDETEDVVIAEDRGFKKRQKKDEGSGWTTIREPTPPPPADEEPQVVDTEESSFKGGLLTSAQLKKTLGKKITSKNELTKEEIEAAQETIYRDASGRKIDTAAERAEAARRKREREEKEAQKMEWGKGLIQREEAKKQRKELSDMQSRPFARTRDDDAMNEELKAQDRWNDPAAAFLTVCHFRYMFPIVSDCITSITETESERSEETRIHWPSAATESFWYQAWI